MLGGSFALCLFKCRSFQGHMGFVSKADSYVIYHRDLWFKSLASINTAKSMEKVPFQKALLGHGQRIDLGFSPLDRTRAPGGPVALRTVTGNREDELAGQPVVPGRKHWITCK